jgi:hypothetical protein
MTVIEAKCNECGAEIAEGCVPHRSLDAFDDDPEAYCPSCQGDDLTFFNTEPPEREDEREFHRD